MISKNSHHEGDEGPEDLTAETPRTLRVRNVHHEGHECSEDLTAETPRTLRVRIVHHEAHEGHEGLDGLPTDIPRAKTAKVAK